MTGSDTRKRRTTWKSLGIAAGSGLLLSFSHPWSVPLVSNTHGYVIDQWWQGLIAWFALAPLFVLLARQTSGRRVFLLAGVSGFFYYYMSIYWVNNAIILYGGLNWVLSVFAVSVLVLYMTFCWTVILWLGFVTSRRLNLNYLLLMPLYWGAHEYLRNYLFTGFPWQQVGYSQAHIQPMLQTAALWGVYGVSVLIAAVNAVWAAWWLVRRDAYPHSRKNLRRYSLAVAGIVVFGLGYGIVRPYLNDAAERRAPAITAAVLQGNINQDIKNRALNHREFILDRFLKLQKQAETANVDLIVWPEAAYPALLPHNLQRAGHMLDMQFPMHAHLLLGAAVVFTDRQDTSMTLGNSMFLLDPEGTVLGRHDKTHLVPFGEYVPYRSLLSKLGIRSIVRVMGNFTTGVSGHLLTYETAIPGRGIREVRNGVLICYEGIFPEISREFVREGANLLVSVTNDAWYGISSAAYQHLLMYAFRSVENRRATIRAANTGISAFIDSSGRVHEATKLYETTWKKRSVPLLEDTTVYTVIGDVFGWIPLLAVLMMTLATLVLWMRSRKGKLQ